MAKIEITGVTISKNPVTAKESFVVSVRVGIWAEYQDRLPFKLGGKNGIKN
ncbi:hypothetical protein AALB39_27655 [Lachnospiraceae bacterium 54-53]